MRWVLVVFKSPHHRRAALPLSDKRGALKEAVLDLGPRMRAQTTRGTQALPVRVQSLACCIHRSCAERVAARPRTPIATFCRHPLRCRLRPHASGAASLVVLRGAASWLRPHAGGPDGERASAPGSPRPLLGCGLAGARGQYDRMCGRLLAPEWPHSRWSARAEARLSFCPLVRRSAREPPWPFPAAARGGAATGKAGVGSAESCGHAQTGCWISLRAAAGTTDDRIVRSWAFLVAGLYGPPASPRPRVTGAATAVVWACGRPVNGRCGVCGRAGCGLCGRVYKKRPRIRGLPFSSRNGALAHSATLP